MIVPSIDIRGGQAVQLVGGRELALEAGDPRPLAVRFGRVGEVAVVDLDAALGTGDNTAVIESLLELAPCRVGGGIRDVAAARRWLDRGAVKVVLGTAAVPEVLRELPRDRVVAALDARDGEVMVEGWQRATGSRIEDRLAALAPHCGGFLVTTIEREGRLAGADLELARRLAAAVPGVRLTLAGGIRDAAEIAALDDAGVDAQVGMALYRGELGLAEAFAAPLLARDPEGPWPTVVCDEGGLALGLVHSTPESLAEALDTGRGVYHSRRRGLWRKGETSGDGQDLLRVDLDCDRDALRFTVRQLGRGFCHTGTWTCWGERRGLERLLARLERRAARAPAGSYTRRLLDDPGLLRAKLVEEAGELADATGRAHVAAEAADLLYFATVALVRSGVRLAAVENELDRRALRLVRRRGDAKTPPEKGPR